MRALAATVLALVAAATGGPTHTPAGQRAARRILLRTTDLGPGWVAGATPRKAGELTCGAQPPTLSGAVETGSAVSPTYREAAGGPFVSEEAFVYRDASAAATFWRYAVGPQLAGCTSAAVAASSTQAVTLSVVSTSRLAVPALGARAVGYRVLAQAKTSAQRVRAYVDVVLVLRGNAITAVSFSSFAVPFPRDDQLRIARAAAARS